MTPELIRDGEARLTGSPHHHLTVVLRLEAGSSVELLDGCGGRHEGILASTGRQASVVTITRSHAPERVTGARLTLLHGLSRARRTELVLQKATELGVDAVVPCLCQRSVSRPPDPDKKHQRWQEIVAQAARQCDRARLPLLAPLMPLDEALETQPEGAVRLVALPGAPPLSAAAPALDGAAEVALLVGPEGGLDPAEAAAAEDRGYVAVGLGPRVLRTETAAVALVALVGYLAGKWEADVEAP